MTKTYSFPIRSFLLAILALIAGSIHPTVATAADARGAMDKPVVILELFTSQGCSSCPPADTLLSRIGRERFAEGAVIPLAFHVDYWNSIGWTDPFSSRQWSERQGRYSAVRRTSQVYTPQLVLNGGAEVVGNDERAVRAEIARQLKAPRAGAVAIEKVTPDARGVSLDLSASLNSSSPVSSGDVYVVLFESGVTTAVKRGENSGRKLTNDYIVRSLTKGFSIRKGSATETHSLTIPIDPSWQRKAIGVAAFIQDPQTLAIQGATSRALQ